MVRPATRQLSPLKLPWQKPTRSQPATSAPNRSPASASSPAARSDSAPSGLTSGYSRRSACSTILRCSSSRSFRSSSLAPDSPWRRRAKRSRWPTRRKEGATRVVMAQGSSIMTSGSRPAPRARSCATTCARCSTGTIASRGSSTVICVARPEYQGRRVESVWLTMRESARVVGTPSAHIASDAKNSRTDDRSTARPSAPRQNGVRPPPFSCISHRCPFTTTSPMLCARPSPYPFPLPKGQFPVCRSPMMLSAYGVAQHSSPGTCFWSPLKNRTNRSDFTSASLSPSDSAIASEWITYLGSRSGVGNSFT
mmetsp:Transcript_47748/g.113050  ORF Transcript_47748/g.113050 Transcript_47748/m.113050 type:complete len:310 (+) Transcript_47748:538-1467(+)